MPAKIRPTSPRGIIPTATVRRSTPRSTTPSPHASLPAMATTTKAAPSPRDDGDALLAAAEGRGRRRFSADILASNWPMLRLLSRLADVRRRELADGVRTVEFERRHPRRCGVRESAIV